MGRTLNALMGNQTSYSVDANGNTVETNAPQPPGQLFRSILASALLGGAAGANGNPAQGFTGGLVRGGAASVAQGQQQDLLKRQQAQQQFQNQQKAAQEQREAGAAVTQQQLWKAQLAHYGIEDLRTNQLIQGENFDLHQKEANEGKNQIAAYKAADILPIQENVPESEMTQFYQDHPGASGLKKVPSGVKMTLDPKTNVPNYELTYNVYDPNKPVPITASVLADYKKNGMADRRPDLFNMLKVGATLPADQYAAVQNVNAQLKNKITTDQRADQDTNEGKARINLQNAEASRDLAEAGKARLEGNKVVLEKTQAQAFNNALTELNKVDGDFDKLSPKSKVLIGESTAKMMPGLTQEIRDVLTADPSDSSGQAKELMKELDSMRHLATYSMRGSAKPASAPGAVLPAVTANAIPQGAVTGIDPKTKQQFYSLDGGKTFGTVTPTPPKSVNEQNADRRALVGGIFKNAINNPLIP
jgi:hypothetical protein